MEKWITYRNGNYTVSINTENGTKIRENDLDFFEADFPENIDIKISDRCDMGCAFCHENSTPYGDNAVFGQDFLWSLRRGTELAIGGGNIFENPQLRDFLKFCKSREIIANVTVNQGHLNLYTIGSEVYPAGNLYELFDMLKAREVYGVGVSYNGDAKWLDSIFEYGNHAKYKDNFVIHVINGVHSYDDIMKLANKGYKILFLGYKDLRRGTTYRNKNNDLITTRQKEIYDNLDKIVKAFKVVSFDNLALEQLDVKRLMTQEEWDSFYMGDDGQHTMYIDLVKEEFAMNSTSLNRHKLLSTIDEMFKVVKEESVK